jgi:hypothetical protein
MPESSRALVPQWIDDMRDEGREEAIEKLLDRAAVGHSNGMPDQRG